MGIPDLSTPAAFLIATVVIFAIVMGRYVLIAGIFYGFFYVWFPNKWERRKLNKKPYSNTQLRKEVLWSAATALIFALSGAAGVLLWQEGYIKVYLQSDDYLLWWMPVSFVFIVLLHETYYYWLHRWMHRPKVFQIVHKVHHDSNITSPWTAFSFHPLEGILQALFLPVVLLFLPMYVYVLLIYLTFMTLSSVINHLNIEVYPGKFNKHFLGKWLIGATHHSLHHKQFKYNFGLYLTFWDRWKRTESPLYHTVFDERTGKVEQ